MPEIINPFDNDAFTLIHVTNAIDIAPYAESRIQRMGLFSEEGITQTTIAISQVDGVLTLVPNQLRGGQAAAHQTKQGVLTQFPAQHLPIESNITSDDIQGKATVQNPAIAATLTAVLNTRLTQMKQSIMTTIEHLRIGAIKGVITDSDGVTVIENLFTRFGITQLTKDFVLGTDGTNIRKKIAEVVGDIENVLGGLGYDHIHAFCSPEFFRNFTTHPKVKEAFNTYGASAQGQFLRDDVRAGFPFGGVIWEEYRGYAGSSGGTSTPFIPIGDCRFFPVGVMNLFQTTWSPSTFLDDVNAVGIPITAKQIPNDLNTATKVHAQSSPFNVCTRPEVLVRGYSSN